MKINQELINKLKQGYIAIDNKGNPNVELLRTVLKEAFPDYKNHAHGLYKYYFSHRFNNENYDYNDFNNQKLPTIPLNDFLEKEQFPKDDFGVIVENNNGKEIIDYLVSKGFIKKDYIEGLLQSSYIYGVKANIIDWTLSKTYYSKTYTLQQLKNLENNMENKEIIGYKAPYDLFGGTYKKGTIFVKDNGDKRFRYKPESAVDSSYWNVAEEIATTWEAVYKSKEVVIRMGNSFDLTIKDGKVWHKSDNITQFVQNLVNCFDYVNKDQSYGQYKAQFKDVIFSSTGCERTETKLSEWILVYNELQKQK